MTGSLIYDSSADRLDILERNGNRYGGLHCGDCIEVYHEKDWIPTRIEYSDDWYLTGLYRSGMIPVGLTVRISDGGGRQ